MAGSRRVRRDGLPAMVLFVLGPFAALLLAAVAHPVDLIDSDAAVRDRVERFRPLAGVAVAGTAVPVDLMLALVATESSGRPEAVSPAGAVGLAQVMPATARATAKRLGVDAGAGLDLSDPALNLRLGAAVLGENLRAFDGDIALALTAYHRGPRDPAAWRRARPGVDGLELVRANATDATRGYVLRVLHRRAWFAKAPVNRSGSGTRDR